LFIILLSASLDTLRQTDVTERESQGKVIPVLD